MTPGGAELGTLCQVHDRNTKLLEMQEIEMATYFSETSKYISKFINMLLDDENEYGELEYQYIHYKSDLLRVYNITKSRNDKQKNHQEMCIIFSILESGLQ